MDQVKKRVQINLPLVEIEALGKRFLAAGLNPEIGLSAAALDTLDPALADDWGRRFGPARVTLHGPFMDLVPGSSDPRVVEVTRDRLRAAVDWARRFGAREMVVHAWFNPFLYSANQDSWLRVASRTFNSLLDDSADFGLVILLENVIEHDPEVIRKVIKKVGRPRLRFCFDTGHFNVWSRVGLKDWLTALGPWLTRIHLHDNHGKLDDHLPVGSGSFDFAALFSWLGERRLGPGLTLEPHTEEDLAATLVTTAELLKKFGRI